MNKTNINTKKSDKLFAFFLLSKIEIKKAFFPGVFIAIFFAIFSLLTLLLSSSPSKGENDVYFQTMLIASIGQASTYMGVYRIVTIFRTNSNLDRDRISYILYSKYILAFSKIISDLILFFATLLITYVVGIVFLITVREAHFSTDYILITISNMVGLLFVFLFTVIGINWIFAAISGGKKWIYIALFFLISFIGVSIFSILLSAIPKLFNWYETNHAIISYIPILNFSECYYILYAFAKGDNNATSLITLVIPSIVYTIIFAVIVWKPFSQAVKNRYCL